MDFFYTKIENSGPATARIGIKGHAPLSQFLNSSFILQFRYSNSITNPVVQVLTNENGLPEDYDVILGYKYNPYKIKGSQKRIQSI